MRVHPAGVQAAQITGWYPLYDTLRGVRGELYVTIKMDFIGDVNPFKESGAGVHFCSYGMAPAGHRVASVIGLVEELIVMPDPEVRAICACRRA